MRFRKWLRRVLCWHKFREVEYRLFCSIVHCTAQSVVVSITMTLDFANVISASTSNSLTRKEK